MVWAELATTEVRGATVAPAVMAVLVDQVFVLHGDQRKPSEPIGLPGRIFNPPEPVVPQVTVAGVARR